MVCLIDEFLDWLVYVFIDFVGKARHYCAKEEQDPVQSRQADFSP